MVAVDAGVHLSAITRLVEESQPADPAELPFTLTDGPFAGLSLPHRRADANAQHIVSMVDSYLITHPHLDHIAGFVVNTAGPPGARPKKLAGLPETILAFKTHIFNNVIWPNLSDENNGAGLVTYLRLVEGGSPALGDGEGRGYSEVCDGLLVKIWGVSHGHCIERHSHRGSASSASGVVFGSHDLASPNGRRELYGHGQPSTQRQSLLSQATYATAASPHTEQEKFCVYDSSAYFIQDQEHRREVLIFGDVEPDSLSLSPRNFMIWQDAAPKICAGSLRAVFIECSYDDSRTDDRLFGHLKPVYVIEELKALAAEVRQARHARSLESKKRKRASDAAATRRSVPKWTTAPTEDAVSPKTYDAAEDLAGQGCVDVHTPLPTSQLPLREVETPRQLEGLKVVIIHVKDRLTDEEDAGVTILRELQQHEQEAQLGCEFIIAKPGQSLYL